MYQVLRLKYVSFTEDSLPVVTSVVVGLEDLCLLAFPALRVEDCLTLVVVMVDQIRVAVEAGG